MVWAIQAFVVVLAVYAALLGYMYYFQNSFLFRPDTNNPFEHDHQPFQPFTYQTAMGLNERGLWYPPDDNKPTIIYFHGNKGSIEDRLGKARKLLAQGYGIALVEYRGYGGNPGVPSEANLMEDGRAAIKSILAKGIFEREIVFYGESLGTGVAVQMALEMPKAKALVLEAPYTSIAEVAAGRYWFLPVRKLIKNRFENDLKIGKLSLPILIVHGTNDMTIPYSIGEKLFALVKSPQKEFISIKGGGHTDLYDFKAEEAVHAFIKKIH